MWGPVTVTSLQQFLSYKPEGNIYLVKLSDLRGGHVVSKKLGLKMAVPNYHVCD